MEIYGFKLSVIQAIFYSAFFFLNKKCGNGIFGNYTKLVTNIATLSRGFCFLKAFIFG